MNRRAFTLVEILTVILISSTIILIVFKLLSGAFSGASKGYSNLSILQEKSRIIATLKQDLRTLIFGGIDNILPPKITTNEDGETTSFEFYKVYAIDEHGRPLIDKITYQRVSDAPASEEYFSITRTCASGMIGAKTYMPKLLTGFKLALLEANGEEINGSSNISKLKKVRLSMDSVGSELLSTTVSVYSSYIPISGKSTIEEMWCPNYMFVQYAPGAPIKVFQGGMLQMSGSIALGTPLSLTGANFLTNP
jgi:prepilin-type N-terminal cleavage/methylation domain-containing protein